MTAHSNHGGFVLPLDPTSRFPIPVLLAAAIERLYDLNVGITPLEEGAPHEKPHKPLLLLAAFDLIDEGLATPERIPWCQELRDRFTVRFLLVNKHNDQNNPDLPFRYLAGDGFWQAFEGDGLTPIRREIRVSDIGQVFARFTDGFQYLVAIPANRQLMREALIARYFPHLSQIGNQQSEITNRQSDLLVAEDTPEYGRSPAFRRKILAIYDHQCAACGLRIRLPAGNDVSFIDAAHLIPFAESGNDHPTNGLALCKNHHWAMDRNLIAPDPDHHWQVSKILDPRRSNGEKELIALSGQALLLPQDEAFHPDVDGLRWRCERLIA
jgi:putative restriction endonuclease